MKNWAEKLKERERQNAQKQFSRRTEEQGAKTEKTGTAELPKSGFEKT